MAKEVQAKKKKVLDDEEEKKRQATKARQTDERLGKMMLPPPLLVTASNAVEVETGNTKTKKPDVKAGYKAERSRPQAQAPPQPQLGLSQIGTLPPKPVFGALSVWPKPALSNQPARSTAGQADDNWATRWADVTGRKDQTVELRNAPTGTEAPLGEPIWKAFNDESTRRTWSTYKDAAKTAERPLFPPTPKHAFDKYSFEDYISRSSDSDYKLGVRIRDSPSSAHAPILKRDAESLTVLGAKVSRQKTMHSLQKINGAQQKNGKARRRAKADTDLVAAAEIQFLAARAFAAPQTGKVMPEPTLAMPSWQPSISASAAADGLVLGKPWVHAGSLSFQASKAAKSNVLVSEWLRAVPPNSETILTSKSTENSQTKDVLASKGAPSQPQTTEQEVPINAPASLTTSFKSKPTQASDVAQGSSAQQIVTMQDIADRLASNDVFAFKDSAQKSAASARGKTSTFPTGSFTSLFSKTPKVLRVTEGSAAQQAQNVTSNLHQSPQPRIEGSVSSGPSTDFEPDLLSRKLDASQTLKFNPELYLPDRRGGREIEDEAIIAIFRLLQDHDSITIAEAGTVVGFPLPGNPLMHAPKKFVMMGQDGRLHLRPGFRDIDIADDKHLLDETRWRIMKLDGHQKCECPCWCDCTCACEVLRPSCANDEGGSCGNWCVFCELEMLERRGGADERYSSNDVATRTPANLWGILESPVEKCLALHMEFQGVRTVRTEAYWKRIVDEVEEKCEAERQDKLCKVM
jgi:hypothetical protein